MHRRFQSDDFILEMQFLSDRHKTKIYQGYQAICEYSTKKSKLVCEKTTAHLDKASWSSLRSDDMPKHLSGYITETFVAEIDVRWRSHKKETARAIPDFIEDVRVCVRDLGGKWPGSQQKGGVISSHFDPQIKIPKDMSSPPKEGVGVEDLTGCVAFTAVGASLGNSLQSEKNPPDIEPTANLIESIEPIESTANLAEISSSLLSSSLAEGGGWAAVGTISPPAASAMSVGMVAVMGAATAEGGAKGGMAGGPWGMAIGGGIGIGIGVWRYQHKKHKKLRDHYLREGQKLIEECTNSIKKELAKDTAELQQELTSTAEQLKRQILKHNQ